MTMDPPPDLTDLIWLFETEPRWPHIEELSEPYSDAAYEEQLWPCTTAIFRLQRKNTWAEMEIHPDHDQVHLIIGVGDDPLADLELASVRTVAVDKRSGRERLRIDFTDHTAAKTLWLQTKPDISLRWAMDAKP
ncbi:hypothetical protein [Nocardia sp. NPDC051570]|uniref:hypothetical protein n=1 Tax=Nocardia sp. NPDC051570 TaxID=3364324 RepID=UPI0037AB436B